MCCYRAFFSFFCALKEVRVRFFSFRFHDFWSSDGVSKQPSSAALETNLLLKTGGNIFT